MLRVLCRCCWFRRQETRKTRKDGDGDDQSTAVTANCTVSTLDDDESRGFADFDGFETEQPSSIPESRNIKCLGGGAGDFVLYSVQVPKDMPPGGRFLIHVKGQHYHVVCRHASPKDSHVRIGLPSSVGRQGGVLQSRLGTSTAAKTAVLIDLPMPSIQAKVAVPNGARAGQKILYKPPPCFSFTIGGKWYDTTTTPNYATEDAGMNEPPRLLEAIIPQSAQETGSFLVHLPKIQTEVMLCTTGKKGDAIRFRLPQSFVVSMKGRKYTVAERGTPATTTAIGAESIVYEVRVPAPLKEGSALFARLSGSTTAVRIKVPEDIPNGKALRFRLPATKPDDSIEATYIQYSLVDDSVYGWIQAVSVHDLSIQWHYRQLDMLELPFELSKARPKYWAFQFVLGLESDGEPTAKLVVADSNESVDQLPADFPRHKCSLSNRERYLTMNDNFDQKCDFFHQRLPTTQECMRMSTRRDRILKDATEVFNAVHWKDLNKLWRYEFVGELGISSSGTSTEWFYAIFDQIFDPGTGLWMKSASSMERYTINPKSVEIKHHLDYFRCTGRLIGQLLVRKEQLPCQLESLYLKAICCWPVQMNDFRKTGLHCSTAVSEFNNEILRPIQAQLAQLLLGLAEVIPLPLLSIFTPSELENMLCRAPNLDYRQLRTATVYTGKLEDADPKQQIYEWFWDEIGSYRYTEMGSFVNFLAGSSDARMKGLDSILGAGSFEIRGVDGDDTSPLQATSFPDVGSVLMLPPYSTREVLKKHLAKALCLEEE